MNEPSRPVAASGDQTAWRPVRRLCFPFFLFVTVAGCGGGSSGSAEPGGSGSNPPVVPPPTPPVAYFVGGNITGLAGSGLVLKNSNGDTLPVNANGVFVFSTPVADGGSYDIRIAAQPGAGNELCGVTAGWGTVAGADVVNVAVSCTPYQVNEYPITGDNAGLVRGSDGNLWGFSRQWDAASSTYSNELYRIDAVGSPTVVPVTLNSSGTLASTASSILDLTAGPDGQIWALTNANVMARTTLAGASANVATLPGAGLGFIALGPVDRDGQVWFWRSPTIGRMNSSGTVTLQQSIPNVGLGSMTLGPDGNIWFTTYGDAATNPDANSVRFITSAGQMTTFPLPVGNPPVEILAGGIATGPDGNLWVTERGQYANKIAKVTPAGIITEYPVSAPGSPDTFAFITPGPDGALWFTGQAGNQVGRITTDGVVTLFGVPTANSSPASITTGPDGRIWFSEIAKVGAIGGLTIPMPGNDNFANADAISGATGHLQTNNFTASAETGEPEHATGVAPQKTLWWRWTAPADGQITINTHGSSHETVIGVYTGTALGSLTQVAQGHQRGNGVSHVTLSVTAGITYSIAVDGYNGASGVLMLDWRMP